MQYPYLSIRAAFVAGAVACNASAMSHADARIPQVEISAGRASASAATAQLRASRSELAWRAGGTAVVDAADYLDGRAATASDALAYAPGVLAQSRHGQETRLSVRGSGIQRGFLLRGVGLYQDGIPLNHADGTGDFQALDPVATQYIEIWRGANALEYGANGLGGAINFVSPTGLSAPGGELRLQAGSFGQRQGHANMGGSSGALDGFVSISRSEQDGWRQQSAYRSERVSANAGVRLGTALDLRGFVSYVDSHLEMPGSLSRAVLDADPRQAAPRYVSQGAVNDFRQKRAALRLTWSPHTGVRWVSSVFASERDRFHAMTMGILQQDMDDTGVDSRLTLDFGEAALTRRLVAGVSLARLDGQEFRFANVGGRAGAATGHTWLDAHQDTVYAEYTHGLDARWSLQAGWQGLRARRQQTNPAAPASSYRVDFSDSAPKLGMLFAPAAGSQWFANVSGSIEAPPFGELVYNPTRPLAQAQGGTTAEIGWRGQLGGWNGDAVVYRSRVRRELLALADAQGIALGTVNADRTVHQGLELSASGTLAPGWRLRTHYLYNDFRFDDDAVYGKRRLAGIAPHLLRADLQWQPHRRLRIAPGVDWQPGRTWVDHANTVAASGHALLSLKLGGELDRRWHWFVEGRNLANRRYVATSAVQANAHGLDGAFYFPGDGRSVYAGLTWRLP